LFPNTEAVAIEIIILKPKLAYRGYPFWLIPIVILLGGLGLSWMKIRQHRLKREQARMKLRVRFERHADSGNQSIVPAPDNI
jgi:hypothetical protein